MFRNLHHSGVTWHKNENGFPRTGLELRANPRIEFETTAAFERFYDIKFGVNFVCQLDTKREIDGVVSRNASS